MGRGESEASGLRMNGGRTDLCLSGGSAVATQTPGELYGLAGFIYDQQS